MSRYHPRQRQQRVGVRHHHVPGRWVARRAVFGGRVFAEPGFVSGRREVTNVPEQALYMLNSPTLATAAQKLAERVLAAHPATATQAHRVQFAYGLIFSRSPNESEQKAATDFFTKFPNNNAAATAWTSFCRALLASAEFRYLN